MVARLRAHDERGFGLVECLLALVIIATGVLGVISMLTQGVALQRSGASVARVTALLADGYELQQLSPALTPAAVTAALAQWTARVAAELPTGTTGAATVLVPSIDLDDGSTGQLLEMRFASAAREPDTTLRVSSVNTEWPP
jgi:prepilin-type N-terminal cleavage/methylation domain-containing protein